MRRTNLILTVALLFVGLPMPAIAASTTLVVAEDVSTPYSRSQFKHWVDANKNGCNTRAEVLIAEATVKPRVAAKCSLVGGKWVSAYDGKTFVKSSLLDVDHMVPLAEAWRSGAAKWTSAQREAYANDLTHPQALIAVSASSNRQKADKDPSDWLPQKGVCTYVSNWISIKAIYSLTVDQIEFQTLKKYIEQCSLSGVDFSFATHATSPSNTSTPTSTPTASSTPTSTPSTTPSPSSTLIQGVTPGAFCSPAGAQGISSTGKLYTCKTSATDSRNRWRQ